MIGSTLNRNRKVPVNTWAPCGNLPVTWTSGLNLHWLRCPRRKAWSSQQTHYPEQGLLLKRQSKSFALLRAVKDANIIHRLFWGWRKVATKATSIPSVAFSYIAHGQRFICDNKICSRKLSQLCGPLGLSSLEQATAQWNQESSVSERLC